MEARGKNCPEKPEELLGQPCGQYHCPFCGMILITGIPHPEPTEDNPDYTFIDQWPIKIKPHIRCCICNLKMNPSYWDKHKRSTRHLENMKKKYGGIPTDLTDYIVSVYGVNT